MLDQGAGLGSLKVLNTALSPDLIRRFHDLNPRAPITYRLVNGDDVVNLPSRTDQVCRDLEPLQRFCDDQLYAEVAINEGFQTGQADLGKLSAASMGAIATYRRRGLKPVVGNFSVGNPPYMLGAEVNGAVVTEATDDWKYFVDVVRAADEANGAIGLHEYGIPSRWLPPSDDNWLLGRVKRVIERLRQLGVRVRKAIIGESGVDRGILNNILGGWRSPEFNLVASQYADLLWRAMLYYASIPEVIAVNVFGPGAYKMWESFSFDTEPSVTDQFRRQILVPEGSMADYPKAELRLTLTNFGYPQGAHLRGGQIVTAIVSHIMQGSMAGALSEFGDPASFASSTYTVGLDGPVRQHVLEADAPWTNGIDFSKGYAAYKSDLTVPWIKECWDKKINPNLRVITIEHEGFSGKVMPEAQYQATLALHRYLVDKYHIPVDEQHLVGHYKLDMVNRPYCPGPTFPWVRLMADLRPSVVVPDNSSYEANAWGSFYRGALFLGGTGDAFDQETGKKVLELLTANKAHHGA